MPQLAPKAQVGTSGFSRKIPAEAGPPAFSPHEFSQTLINLTEEDLGYRMIAGTKQAVVG